MLYDLIQLKPFNNWPLFLWEILPYIIDNTINIDLKRLFIPPKYGEQYLDFTWKLTNKEDLLKVNYKTIKDFFQKIKDALLENRINSMIIYLLEGPFFDQAKKGLVINNKITNENITYRIGIHIGNDDISLDTEKILVKDNRNQIFLKRVIHHEKSIICTLKRILLLGSIDDSIRYSFPILQTSISKENPETNIVYLNIPATNNPPSLKDLIDFSRGRFFDTVDPSKYLIFSNIEIMLTKIAPIIHNNKILNLEYIPETFRLSKINWESRKKITCNIIVPNSFLIENPNLNDVYLTLNELDSDPERSEELLTITQKVEHIGFQQIEKKNALIKSNKVAILLTYQNKLLVREEKEMTEVQPEEGLLRIFQIVNDKIVFQKEAKFEKMIQYLSRIQVTESLLSTVVCYFGQADFFQYKERRDSLRNLVISLETSLEKIGYIKGGLGFKLGEFISQYYSSNKNEWDYCTKSKHSDSVLNFSNNDPDMRNTANFDQKWKELTNLQIDTEPIKTRLETGPNRTNIISKEIGALLLSTLVRNLVHITDHKNIYLNFYDYRTTVETIIFAYIIVLDKVI